MNQQEVVAWLRRLRQQQRKRRHRPRPPAPQEPVPKPQPDKPKEAPKMSYAPDPGGQFDSDVHRRVAGILASPTAEGQALTTDDVIAGVARDDNLNIGYDEAGQVITDLINAGAAVAVGDGLYGLTEAGAAAFPSPHASDGGPEFHA